MNRFKFDDFGGYWWNALNGIREFERFTTPFRIESYTLGALYDTDRYELVEKKDFAEKRIKEKEAEIAELERNKESVQRYYNMRIAKAKEEKEKLANK